MAFLCCPPPPPKDSFSIYDFSFDVLQDPEFVPPLILVWSCIHFWVPNPPLMMHLVVRLPLVLDDLNTTIHHVSFLWSIWCGYSNANVAKNAIQITVID
jgi:hypothetical protein